MTERRSISSGAGTHRELAGRVALVTGAGRGIGRGIAHRLAAEGATVVLGYRRDAASATDAVESILAAGGCAEARALDVTDPDRVGGVVAGIAAHHGRIDILVNNAGVMRRAPFLDASLEDWQVIMQTNLIGCFAVAQAAARLMVAHGGGAIVNVSSVNEETASANCTAYAASKGGVRMLTRQMALELGPLGIRTNAVAPGMVQTDLNRTLLADRAVHDAALARVPTGRFATVSDVADAVLFLVSDRAASVNGISLVVDGGKLAA
jgi:NAD(P)-dependent dehydrogenase (short-subunit alcohol dehydrogenase family)